MSRSAKCFCGRTRPSSERDDLAFFEDRGPGNVDHVCKNCRYHLVAHERKVDGLPLHRSKVVCDNFEPMVDGYEFDTYYCGCRGWD